MTEISTYSQAKGSSLVPLTTNDATERNDKSIGGPTLLCASQDKIEIVFDDEGNASITQTRWPDEDQTIVVSRDNLSDFLDRLCDALGVPSMGTR
jgi:hypothetical protein